MKTLPLTFNKYGHAFNQIARQENVALYRRTNSENRVICYELIIITVTPEKILPSGKTAPAQEFYPNTDKFGRLGWSLIHCTEEKALSRFRDLVAKQQQKALKTSDQYSNPKQAA